MYIATFIFKQARSDAEFERLNTAIEAVAASLPGFAGAESWLSTDGALANSTYYWHDQESLQVFARHPAHLEAQRRNREWYDGHHVIVSKVERAYGDGRIEHFVQDSRRSAPAVQSE